MKIYPIPRDHRFAIIRRNEVLEVRFCGDLELVTKSYREAFMKAQDLKGSLA